MPSSSSFPRRSPVPLLVVVRDLTRLALWLLLGRLLVDKNMLVSTRLPAVVAHRKCIGEDRAAYLTEGDAVTYEVGGNNRSGKYARGLPIGPI